MTSPSESVLDGIWQLVRAELDGESAHELLTANTVLELKAGTYAVRYAGEVTDRGTFELGGSGEAKTVVLLGIEGQNSGRTIPCIYQCVGDRLRMCFGLDGVLPTDYEVATGQHRYLATYRRVRVSDLA